MRHVRVRTAVAVLGVLLLAGCSSSSPKISTTPVSTSTSTPAPALAKTAASAPAKTAKVGDTVDLSGDNKHIQVTLVKIVDPVKSTNQYMTPDPGKRFVAVQVRIVNAGTVPYTADPMGETQAKDADGQIFDADISPLDTAVGQAMDSGLVLAPGDKTLGVMTFTVPSSSHLVAMRYAINVFGGNIAQWTLS